MQNAKDTFYVALRDRLAALNPARTAVIRGALRPAVLVAENELESAEDHVADTFVLVWHEFAVDTTEPMPLCSAVCEVQYATRGTQLSSGMDRGRVLQAMDGELRSVLEPRCVPKQGFNAAAPVTLSTAVFWSEPEFGVVTRKDEWLRRTATVTVLSLQEVGER